MNNILYKAFALMMFVLMMTSCEKSLSELNIDPNNPTEVGLNLQMPEMLTQAAFNEGLNPNRVAGIVLQQFFGLDAQQLEYNAYIIKADGMNNYWNTALYGGVLRSADVIIKTSGERPFYGAVAKIITANELGKATSYWGDIPWDEALKGTDNLRPAYQSQESIYDAVQSLLDEAIASLDAGAGGYFGGDLVYDGDGASWAKLAHGLKARYYLQTAKRNPANYATAAAHASNSFASNAEAGGFQFGVSETANWSLAKFGIERPSTLGLNENFAAMLDGDPRLAKYGTFDGTQWAYFDGAEGDLTWGRSDAKIPIISYVELMFIQAENAARNGGDASTMLKTAIDASMELVGATDTIGYSASASTDGSVENVIIEAYKAYYGFNFHETWANWRRTGYPALTPSSACGDNGFNPTCAIPQRYLYAESEQTTNRISVEAAKAAQGGDLLDNPMWAFK